MNFGMQPSSGSLRHLWRLEPQVYQSGLPRRAGLLRLVLMRSGFWPVCEPQTLLLVDGNSNKEVHARREFKEECVRIDAVRAPLDLRARILLLITAILPSRGMAVFGTTVLAANHRRQLPDKPRICLYNPQHLLPYAVSEAFEVEKVFHLAPEYPRVRAAKFAYACSAAHEILGYDKEQRRNTNQPNTFVSSNPSVRVYLTQLHVLRSSKTESALIDFARWVRNRLQLRVEVFLHYLDRDVNQHDPFLIALFNEFGDMIRHEPSLHSLSTTQVSVSGTSSIGYDLLSLDVCHLMVYDPDTSAVPIDGSVWPRLTDWRHQRSDVIRFDEPFRAWLDALYATDAVSFQAVFHGTPEAVEARAKL